MTTISSSTLYAPSTLAYPHLNQMLDSLPSGPVSSTSSTFNLPTSCHFYCVCHCHVFLFNTAAIISFMPSATQTPSSPSLALLPEDAVATTVHLQQFSAVRQQTRDLQQRETRHPPIRHNCLMVKLAHPHNELFTQLFIKPN